MGILLIISVTLCLALFDIAFKALIENGMTRGEERTACKGKLIIRKVYNRGFCLNLMEKKEELVKYGSVIATMILTIWQLITLLFKKRPLRKAGLSLMTAGAWSNTFDRWFKGYVVDYAAFPSKSKKARELTFNLADVFIVFGAVLVMISSLFHEIRKKK